MQLPRAAAPLLYLLHHILPVFGVQIARVIPKAVGSASHVYGHGAYVDQKVRRSPSNFLNHEDWHLRNVVASPAVLHNASATILAASSSIITFNATSLGSQDASSAVPPKVSSSRVTLNATILPSALRMTETLETGASADWDGKTDAACSTALASLNGVATNPSGISACYNIRSFNASVGAFQADLRLYRIASPTGDWTQLKQTGVNVGLSYVGASTEAGTSNKEKRRATPLSRPAPESGGGRGIHLRRSKAPIPKKLEGFTFKGSVFDDLDQLTDDTVARSLLVPTISLSGTNQDGSPLKTQISIEDASFVNGIFANQSPRNEASKSPKSASISNGEIPDLPNNRLAAFPTDLIIVSAWTVIYITITGYGTISRIRARETHRRRIKSRLSGGINTARWA